MKKGTYYFEVYPVWGSVRLFSKFKSDGNETFDFSIDLPINSDFYRFLRNYYDKIFDNQVVEMEYKDANKKIKVKCEQYIDIHENYILSFCFDYFDIVFKFEVFRDEFESTLKAMLSSIESLI